MAQELFEQQGRQISLFPDTIQKARGVLMDEVMSSEMLVRAKELVISDRAMPEESVPVSTRVVLSYSDIRVDGPAQLNDIDRDVIDAVASLFLYGDYCTAGNIYCVMTGKRKGITLTPSQVGLVLDSMEKLARCRIYIRLPDIIVDGEKKKVPIQPEFAGQMVAFEVVSLSVDGEKRDALYKILSMPAIFRYAQSIGRVSEFPLEMLNTPPAKTRSILMVQSYLLRRIDAFNRGEAVVEPILWRDLKERGGWSSSASRTTDMRIRNAVCEILDYWKAYGFFLDYSYRKNSSGGILIKPAAQPLLM